MGRAALLAAVGIAVLFGASVAGIYWITAGDADGGDGAGSAPPPPAPVSAAPLTPASPQAPAPQAPPSPSPLLPDRAPVPAPVAPPPAAPPPVPVDAPPALELSGSTPALEQVIRRRCGAMRLRALSERGSAPAGATVLVLELSVQEGEARIAGSVVQTPGATRPSFISCAQWALRGQRVRADGASAEGPVRVPVLLGVEGEP